MAFTPVVGEISQVVSGDENSGIEVFYIKCVIIFKYVRGKGNRVVKVLISWKGWFRRIWRNCCSCDWLCDQTGSGGWTDWTGSG